MEEGQRPFFATFPIKVRRSRFSSAPKRRISPEQKHNILFAARFVVTTKAEQEGVDIRRYGLLRRGVGAHLETQGVRGEFIHGGWRPLYDKIRPA